MLLLLSIAIVTSKLARVVNMFRSINYSLIFVVFFVIGASACSAGDKPCHCKKLGGEWRPAEGNLAPACRVFYNHQGRCICFHELTGPAAAAVCELAWLQVSMNASAAQQAEHAPEVAAGTWM